MEIFLMLFTCIVFPSFFSCLGNTEFSNKQAECVLQTLTRKMQKEWSKWWILSLHISPFKKEYYQVKG